MSNNQLPVKELKEIRAIAAEGHLPVVWTKKKALAYFREKITPLVVMQISDELMEHRKACNPELKPANLINKFYERYPTASFKSDGERATALGYFMAGAELQCFGEFVKYEELCSDE